MTNTIKNRLDGLPLRELLWATFAFQGLATWQLYRKGLGIHAFLFSYKWNAVLLASMLALLLELFVLERIYRKKLDRAQTSADEISTASRPILISLLVVIPAGVLYAWIALGPLGANLNSVLLRLFLLWIFALICGSGLWMIGANRSIWQAIFFSGIGIAVMYRAAAYWPDLTNYPFSLGYSEANRYYYASLLFSQRLYGMELPLSSLHPTRYFLQSIPFLLPHVSLFTLRLWQVCLWVALPLLTAALMLRRFASLREPQAWLMIGWVFLFFFQGPVYYHLLVSIILILVGYSKQRPLRTLLFVILASVWAGLSRINWVPVPAFLAALLYLLESPLGSVRKIWQYVRSILIWGVAGGLSAFGAYLLYAYRFASDSAIANSSFSSPLLWYRLFPNPTFDPGILPGLLLISGPLSAWLLAVLLPKLRRVAWLRWAGIIGMLLVMLVGGLVVSVKIGGGGNLHNLDAWLILLVQIALYVYFGKIIGEDGERFTPALPSNLLLGLLLVIPIAISLAEGRQVTRREVKAADNELAMLQQEVGQVTDSGGKVLFIEDRHLIALGEFKRLELIPQYEKVMLVEAAMSGNDAYFESFYNALDQKQYDLIVSPPLRAVEQDRTSPSSEENNVWVNAVVRPILDRYQVEQILEPEAIWLLTPKHSPRGT